MYRTLRDVKQGEELCISYGSNLWFVDSDAASSSEEPEDPVAVLAQIDLDED